MALPTPSPPSVPELQAGKHARRRRGEVPAHEVGPKLLHPRLSGVLGLLCFWQGGRRVAASLSLDPRVFVVIVRSLPWTACRFVCGVSRLNKRIVKTPT